MTIEAPHCIDCKHFDAELQISGKWSCKAFPSIPEQILKNEVMHGKHIKTQKGDYVFESKEKSIE